MNPRLLAVLGGLATLLTTTLPGMTALRDFFPPSLQPMWPVVPILAMIGFVIALFARPIPGSLARQSIIIIFVLPAYIALHSWTTVHDQRLADAGEPAVHQIGFGTLDASLTQFGQEQLRAAQGDIQLVLNGVGNDAAGVRRIWSHGSLSLSTCLLLLSFTAVTLCWGRLLGTLSRVIDGGSDGAAAAPALHSAASENPHVMPTSR